MGMTEARIQSAFEQCRELLPNYLTADRGGTWQRHLIFMCQEAATFSNREKAMRWLGFIQGALWTKGLATIDELKDMNRPTAEDDQEVIDRIMEENMPKATTKRLLVRADAIHIVPDFIPCIIPPESMRIMKTRF